MNSGTDTMDLIGTFEQYDPQARSRHVLSTVLLEIATMLGSHCLFQLGPLCCFLRRSQGARSRYSNVCFGCRTRHLSEPSKPSEWPHARSATRL